MKQLAQHILSLFKLSKVGFLIAISLPLPLALTLPLTLNAQAYPAIVTVNMQPPFSPYLTDFLQIGQERVFLNVNFLDQNEPSWDAKLRLTIEGNGLLLKTSRPYYQAVTLSPGPNLIDIAQLEQLLDFSKMDVQGMNKNDLVNAGRLPEGTYSFCAEVVDANREIAFALPGCFTATLIQNNPPQLVSPECGAVISAATGQNIQFNWIPMHDPSIQVRYEMKLVQVPPGMNVNDAINNTSFPILDWLPINMTSFTYGPEQLPLDLNQKYAFQIRVVVLNGLTTFENDGKAPVCWFTYGYSNDGTIDLTAPAHQVRVDDPEKVDFAWSGPSNATNGQPLKYHIKVVKLAPGERVTNQAAAASYMDRTAGVWYDDSTGIMPNIYGGSITVEQPLEPDAYYAWQVRSSTDGFKTAKSEIWEFRAPPVIFAFWVADGAYMVTVTNTTNYTKVNANKYTNLTGTGTLIAVEGEQPTELNYAGLQVEMIANKWVLTAGEIVAPKVESKELDFGDYGDGTYEVNAWVFTSTAFLAQGQVKWHFPLSVNAPGNAMVVSDENVRLNYLNRILSGAVLFAEGQSYDLLIPMGFKVRYLQPSQFLIAAGGATTLKLSGRVDCPTKVKTVSGDQYSIPFENIMNPWYMEIPRQAGGDQLVLFSNTKMSLQPKTFVVDFSGSQSPAGLFQNQPEWVGVYFNEYNVFLPTDFDEKGQLIIDEAKVLTYVYGQPGFQHAFIAAGGLNLDLLATFEQVNAPPYYATVNTFQGKLASLRLKIEDNSLNDSKFKGFVKVPFLSAAQKFDWTAPIASNGIQTSYFNEDSTLAFSKTYNPTDASAKLKLEINQAIFEGGDHIVLNVDLEWPKMDVRLEGMADLKVWGNGELGFTEPNGTRALTNQVQVKLGNMTGTTSTVSATLEGGAYGFTLFTNVSVPTGMTSPIAPIKVAVAATDGGQAPNMTYTRADGQTENTRFRFGPVKVTMENELLEADLFADYIEDDPFLGSRFEAKGNVLVLAPYKTVATARLVVGKKEGTKFWYARCAAQGLNIVLDENFSLNGFDFKMYHHLSTPPGFAAQEDLQFDDFWNLNAALDGANSIEGHVIDAGTKYGQYGKIGLHDTPSGQKLEKKPVDLSAGIPEIGDILPNIPGLCDLQYNNKSLCSYVHWPWEGLDICDLKIPYTENGSTTNKSICEVHLLNVPWPNIGFCDLMMPNGKRLCDFTLGELGFSGIDICDLKLPNGASVCDFFDISGTFCNINTTTGSLCNIKLGNLFPDIPPICQWKIPGVKPMCDFKVGDILPDMDICRFAGGGNSIFCNWSWPNVLPDIPNPCDLRLPNGTKLCSLTANWCDIIVPVVRNGSPQLIPLCEVKGWELDWPNVNVCEWKIGGQPLCNLNFKFCDLRFPVSEQRPCDFIPNFCDLVEPTSGKKFCTLGLFDIDWTNFNFCDLTWPGSNRKACDLSFKYCDIRDPRNAQAPPLCNLKWPDLWPNIPQFCDLQVKMPNGSFKRLCDVKLDINLPSICDLKVGTVPFCKIKLPDYAIPEIPNIPPIPTIPGKPKNMLQWLFMMGVRTEFTNNNKVEKYALDGLGWSYTSADDPNSSYLARGSGWMEIFPDQKKVNFELEGESGSVKTDLGRIKPFCAEGTVKGYFNGKDDWEVNVGTRNDQIEVELGCISDLRNDGYLKASPAGISAHGVIERHAETSYSVDLEVATVEFYAEGDLDMDMGIDIAFDEVAIGGSLHASVSARVGAEWSIADDHHSHDFGTISVSGKLAFKIDDGFCMSGKMTGRVSILDQGVSVPLGVKIKGSSISFPPNPSVCD